MNTMTDNPGALAPVEPLAEVAHASATRLAYGVTPPADFVGTVTRPDGKVEQWRYGQRESVAGPTTDVEEPVAA